LKVSQAICADIAPKDDSEVDKVFEFADYVV